MRLADAAVTADMLVMLLPAAIALCVVVEGVRALVWKGDEGSFGDDDESASPSKWGGDAPSCDAEGGER